MDCVYYVRYGNPDFPYLNIKPVSTSIIETLVFFLPLFRSD